MHFDCNPPTLFELNSRMRNDPRILRHVAHAPRSIANRYRATVLRLGGSLRASTEIARLDPLGRLPFGRERTVEHKKPKDLPENIDRTVTSQAEEFAADPARKDLNKEGQTLFKEGRR